MNRLTVFLLAAGAALLLALPASAQTVKCKLRYDLKGWSIFYRYADGTGRITCTSGQSVNVRIRAHAGGVTFGTQQVTDGTGSFSAVSRLDDLYGTYFDMGAHAGAGRGADARFMMKGSGNLSLSGTGQGISIGFSFGGFTIRPR